MCVVGKYAVSILLPTASFTTVNTWTIFILPPVHSFDKS